jgi:lipoprotein NlpI
MRIFVACSLALLLQGAAAAQSRDENWASCNDPDPALNILACTAIIHSGTEKNQNLAAALSNRCAGYAGKGDFDSALADCSRAINLNPNFVPALVNRAGIEGAKGDYDRALRDYSAAIWLKPGLAKAFVGRASIYAKKGDNDRALDDYNQGIRLDPTLAQAFAGRASFYEERGEHDRAIQDYDQAIRLDPQSPSLLRNRGRARFYLGEFASASDDFRNAVRFAPDYPYAPIWLYLAQNRAGEDGARELERNAAKLDLTKWPAPIVLLYRGKYKPEDVVSAATNTDPKTDREQHCEAYFYLGEYALFHNEQAEAAQLFRSTIDTGVTVFLEYSAAQNELKRLSASAK